MVSLEAHDFKILMESNVLIFAVAVCTFVVTGTIAEPESQRFTAMLSLKSVIVVVFIFRFMTHFELVIDFR